MTASATILWKYSKVSRPLLLARYPLVEWISKTFNQNHIRGFVYDRQERGSTGFDWIGTRNHIPENPIDSCLVVYLEYQHGGEPSPEPFIHRSM